MDETLYDEEDDDLWIEDPYDEADDLAEHTMHSPVLVNYDPALESAEVWTDWDDYSDDFFDSESPRPKQRKANAMGNAHAAAATPKRRKRKSSGNLSEFSLGGPASSNDERQHPRPQPTVVWKSRGDSPKLPIIRQGQEEQVSILKDWRSRIKPSPQSSDTKSRTSNGSQRAIAVVIQHTPNTNATPTPPSCSSSKRKRYRDDEDPVSTFEPGSEHKNRPTTKKKRKQTTPPPAADDNTPTPALTNGISQRTKRKRKLETETNEQTLPKKRKKDARGTPKPEKPSKQGRNPQ